MKNDDLEGAGELADDIAAMLGRAKDIPDLGTEVKAALFSDVAARIGLPPTPGGDGGGDGGPGPSTAGSTGGGTPAPALPGGEASTFALAGGKAVAALLATFAVGLAAGIAIDRGIAPPAGSVPNVPVATSATVTPSPERPVPEPSSPAVPVTALPSVPASAARPTITAPAAPEPSAAPSPSARGLAAERALLDVARGALARGEARASLEAAQRHAAEYPSGALVEEREAIAIKALVALGRRDEARARAAEMERRFPNGLMLRAVRSAVETAP